jgi:Glycosyl hydrolases family 43/FlgD Ig-like domain
VRTAIQSTALAAVLLVPTPALCIQARWSSGESDVSFQIARLCTLVVESDDHVRPLPEEWRILWTSDSATVRPCVEDGAGLPDQARVCGLRYPAQSVQVEANEVTAAFCSDGDIRLARAAIGLQITGPGRGKLAVVAIDPDDSTRVLRSEDVTFNGGVGSNYRPVILSSSYRHDGGMLDIDATGIGLDEVDGVALADASRSWRERLTIASQDSGHLKASIATIADVPACNLEVGAGSTTLAGAQVPGEEIQIPADLTSAAGAYLADPDSTKIYPKDFSLIHAGDGFHLFYIRAARNPGNADPTIADSSEKSLGHGVSTDLNTWTVVDTTVLRVRNGRFGQPASWDNWHVWAPYVRQIGLTYYMWYTGIGRWPMGGTFAQTQRIGLATSNDLVNWSRTSNNVSLSILQVPWAAQDTTYLYPGFGYPAWQLRDPFVMWDAADHRWLMYYSTAMTNMPTCIIGVATSTNLTSWTAMPNPLRITDGFNQFALPGSPYSTMESPHLFYAQGKWWLVYTTGAGTPATVSWNNVKPFDDTPGDSLNWIQAGGQRLWRIANFDTSIQTWFATEYLKLPVSDDLATGTNDYPSASWKREYFGGVDGNHLYVRQLSWLGASSFTLDTPGDLAGVHEARSDTCLGLVLVGFKPGLGEVRFRIDSPSVSRARLSVYDVGGRRVRTLLEGQVAAGRTAAVWDGRLADGSSAGAGVYFVRLETSLGHRLVRVPMFR